MRRDIYEKLKSQLELPFQTTEQNFLKVIFETLRKKFQLKVNSKQKLIDLGSGNGIVIIYSALYYKILSVGVEIDKNLIVEAKERITELKKRNLYKRSLFRKIRLIESDLFKQNLKEFDFIYIYSLPTMQKYLVHVFKTAKKEAIIISYKYPLKGFNSFLRLSFRLDFQDKQNRFSVYYYKIIS